MPGCQAPRQAPVSDDAVHPGIQGPLLQAHTCVQYPLIDDLACSPFPPVLLDLHSLVPTLHVPPRFQIISLIFTARYAVNYRRSRATSLSW